MVNESLGTICNAHVVHADISDALDEKCVKLAELAALAVDFPKTGKIVVMPNELRPKMYPDFMGKPESQTYTSEKILGRMYRRIIDYVNQNNDLASEVNFSPGDITYDTDLEVAGSEYFINKAWDLKCSYVGKICGLLAQYEVRNEAEIVTGHVWSLPKSNSKKQGELKEKLKHAYNCLKREFRQQFDELGTDFEHVHDEERNIIYEKKASAWYQVTYHSKWVKKALEVQGPDGNRHAEILSFAWVPADYLARIKIRHGGKGNQDDMQKPINSLAHYLATCMHVV